MNPIPHGKISRLPHSIREQLHQRLGNGDRAKTILEWLNSTPEVQPILATEYAARPITARNLSAWKKHSHASWLNEQEAALQAAQFITESRELAQAGQGQTTDHLAAIVAAQLSVAVTQLLAGPPSDAAHQHLTALGREFTKLRRTEIQASRLRLQRQRHESKLSKNSITTPK
jgi:hypothetical protein